MSIEPIGGSSVEPCEYCGKADFTDEKKYPNKEYSPAILKALHVNYHCPKYERKQPITSKEKPITDMSKVNTSIIPPTSSVLPPQGFTNMSNESTKPNELVKQSDIESLKQQMNELKGLITTQQKYNGEAITEGKDKLEEVFDEELIERTDKQFGAIKKVVFSPDALEVLSYINKKGIFGKEMSVDDFLNRCIVEFARRRGWEIVMIHKSDMEAIGE